MAKSKKSRVNTKPKARKASKVSSPSVKPALKSLQKFSKNIAKRNKKYDKLTAKLKSMEDRYSKYSSKRIENAIKKAEENVKLNADRVQELRKLGIPVYSTWDKTEEMNKLEKYKTELKDKGTLDWMTVGHIVDMGKKNYYNNITRVTLQVVDKERSTDTAKVTKSEEFTIAKIEQLAQKELNSVIDPDKKGISEASANAVKQWIEATRIYKSDNEVEFKEGEIEGKSDDEIRRLVESRMNKGKIDVSWAGGMSSLINDLRYIALAEGDIGRDLVQYISEIMQDKVIFAKIESYYQSSKGRDLRDKINKAVGSDMYDGIKLIYEAFDKLLDTLAFEGIVNDEQLEQLQEKTTRLASEALYGGEEIYY